MNKLLSVADAIEMHRVESELSMDTFYRIINNQGQIKHLERRVRDILRVFEASHWITRNHQSPDILYLTENYHQFIHAWNSGDHLLPMNQGLTNYPPYARFLNCLMHEKSIKIPQRQNKESRRNLGRYLKEKYDITFVAFDTFRTWAVSVGHAYRSPFEEILYWGGDWGEERPSLDHFKIVCEESYHQIDKTSGYANLGHLAHLVCKKLSISFQAFEMKINQFIEAFPGEIKLAPATIRCEVSGHFQIISIRPRKEILRERLSAKIRGAKVRAPKPQESQWLEHRYLEDGMRVNRKLVKLIQWEARVI